MIEKIAYEGLPNCYRIYNDEIELITPTDIGPRILRFGFIGQQNEFVPVLGWGFSAHRLWHAPEAYPRSYLPDKEPVTFKQHDTFIRLTENTEKETGIQKELDIPLSPTKNHISITHRLYNRGLWSVEIAPWAISAMATGGKAIFPLTPRKPATQENLLPTSLLSIWEYSDLADTRFKFGSRYIMLHQDVNCAGPTKIGLMDTNGWIAYWNKGHLFVKTFDYQKGRAYPDLGSSAEAYTNNNNLELETVAPLKLVQPGESVEHVENWYLFHDVAEPLTDADIDTIEKHIPPLKMD
jgi:hypothetical protein